jgi:hypothetical protein
MVSHLKVGTLKVRYSSLRSRRLVRAEEERASSSTQANVQMSKILDRSASIRFNWFNQGQC